ncbi:MAG TPA: TetR/AcrR family transcriptional regulator [Deltaproteobacteria bacterium]|nr:TetR/AcrR family transcriptional regulator [Deltaproteobacteria bacterium]
MPKDRYHHGDVQRALITSATALIEARGLEGFSLARASRDIGVTHAAAYRYFDGKEDLLTAVAEAGMIALRDALVSAWEAPGTPRGEYLASGRAVVAFARAHPRWYALMMGGLRSDDAESPASAPHSAFSHLVQRIRCWQAQGWLAAGDPVDHALLLWATAHGLASLVASGRLTMEPEALSDQLLLALHQGIAPRQPGHRAGHRGTA